MLLEIFSTVTMCFKNPLTLSSMCTGVGLCTLLITTVSGIRYQVLGSYAGSVSCVSLVRVLHFSVLLFPYL